MSRARSVLIGGALGAVVLLGCLASAAAVHWYEEGREIALCGAAKDFWQANHRAPRSIAELPEPYSSYRANRDGAPYAWSCSEDGSAPFCGVSWTGPGLEGHIGRSCGRLDERSWTDWL